MMRRFLLCTSFECFCTRLLARSCCSMQPPKLAKDVDDSEEELDGGLRSGWSTWRGGSFRGLRFVTLAALLIWTTTSAPEFFLPPLQIKGFCGIHGAGERAAVLGELTQTSPAYASVRTLDLLGFAESAVHRISLDESVEETAPLTRC